MASRPIPRTTVANRFMLRIFYLHFVMGICSAQLELSGGYRGI
jgi:hypothetical protein